ncbi:MAG: hypothetical protein IAE99_08435 [Rhodothermales bacterium]|nr:hypothetical protein [Rhodothermales bacterium]
MKAFSILVAGLLALAPTLHAQPWTPRGGYPQEIRAVDRKAAPTSAQRVVLEVSDGAIRLNGQNLDAEQMPASLNAAMWPTGTAQRFVFSGSNASTVEINGVRYRIGPHGLTVDTDLTRVPDAVVSFLDDRGQTTLPFGARSLILVNETAPYAAEQEYALEVSTFELATRIRALPDGPARTEALQLLQQHLRELFDFKQAQRSRELDALERELQTLRQQHAARSRNREAIVRQRMHELLAQ